MTLLSGVSWNGYGIAKKLSPLFPHQRDSHKLSAGGVYSHSLLWGWQRHTLKELSFRQFEFVCIFTKWCVPSYFFVTKNMPIQVFRVLGWVFIVRNIAEWSIVRYGEV